MAGAELTAAKVAEAYFNRFAQAFATFDGTQVADLFLTPSVALRGDGSLVSLATPDDLSRYYQAALDRYHREGARSCQWSQLSVAAMGGRGLMAAVTWDLLRSDGTPVVRWRQSYCLSLRGRANPKAFAMATHAE